MASLDHWLHKMASKDQSYANPSRKLKRREYFPTYLMRLALYNSENETKILQVKKTRKLQTNVPHKCRCKNC